MANNKKDDNYDDECQILYGIKKMKNKQIDLCVARLKVKNCFILIILDRF